MCGDGGDSVLNNKGQAKYKNKNIKGEGQYTPEEIAQYASQVGGFASMAADVAINARSLPNGKPDFNPNANNILTAGNGKRNGKGNSKGQPANTGKLIKGKAKKKVTKPVSTLKLGVAGIGTGSSNTLF